MLLLMSARHRGIMYITDYLPNNWATKHTPSMHNAPRFSVTCHMTRRAYYDTIRLSVRLSKIFVDCDRTLQQKVKLGT